MNATHLVDRESMMSFLTAGKCECSIKNEDSGKHFAYKLKKAKKEYQRKGYTMYFVSVSYEYRQYAYAGVLYIYDNGRVGYSKGNNRAVYRGSPIHSGYYLRVSQAYC